MVEDHPTSPKDQATIHQSGKKVVHNKKMSSCTAKLSGRDYEFRIHTPRQEQFVKSEDLSAEIQGESGESQPVQPTDDAEACTSFWSIQGDFIFIVITTNLEFNSVCRRKKHSLFY